MSERTKRFWQRVNDYGNDETRDPFSHSGSYHRHFQGWAERRVARENGKGTRIERVYVADYFRYEETDTVWKSKKLILPILFLLMAALSVLADTRDAAVNHIQAIGIMQILAFLPMVYLLYRLVLQLAAPRNMTVGERDAAVDGFRKASLIYAIVLAALTVAMPMGAAIVQKSIGSADWTAAGLKLLSAAAAFLLHFTEKRRSLTKVPNEKTAPSESNEIW
jgi:hypothetical protein